jgi:hypothetical protein
MVKKGFDKGSGDQLQFVSRTVIGTEEEIQQQKENVDQRIIDHGNQQKKDIIQMDQVQDGQDGNGQNDQQLDNG